MSELVAGCRAGWLLVACCIKRSKLRAVEASELLGKQQESSFCLRHGGVGG
jgi:hypothetical protein